MCGLILPFLLCLRSGVRASRHLFVLLCLSSFRFGEASHPGPSTFALGSLNATGLQGKHGIVAQLSDGLYAASETHLTSRGVAEFNKGLFFAQSPFKLLPGAPAKPRHNSAFVGDYTGVGFLSSVPTRAACHSWHPNVLDTARLQVVHAFASPLWILAGVCYGFASGPPSRTHQLLDFLSDRVVDSATGPRVIAGDFNLLEDANPFVAHWEQRGFVEIQRLWARVSGQPMRPTCKHCTRKDFVYISPELVPLVQSVEVQDDWFADHAILLARLRLPSAPLARPIWRQPRPRQVSNAVAVAITGARSEPGGSLQHPSSAQARYAGIWEAHEAVVSRTLQQAGLPALTAAEKGRGRTLEVTIRRGEVPPVRKSRPGEVSPQYFGQNRRYAHWFRQLRRLQALVQGLKKGSTSDAAVAHRAANWHAVISAPGFAPGFVEWWTQRPHRLFHAPAAVPFALPSLPALESIFQCFEINFRSFERDLLRHRRVVAKARRAKLPSLIFRDIQRERSCPVSTLIEGPRAQVVELCQEECAVEVAPDQPWRRDLPVFLDDIPYLPVHVEPDKVWLDRPLPQAAASVSQQVHLASLPELFRAFGEAWADRWLRHAHVSPDRWSRALQAIDQVLCPGEPLPYQPITALQWRQAVRAKKPTSAPGPDGVSRLDLLLMPEDLLEYLLEVCSQAERTGEWPVAAMTAIVSALEKTPGAGRVNQFRPISVLSFVYRVWASIRSKELLAFLSQCAPPHLFGFMPGRSSQTVWYALQHQLEIAHLTNEPLCGVTTDLEKAFNFLPRLPVFAFAAHVGIPFPVIRAWTASVTTLTRRFKIHGSVGPPIASLTGFPEGDPMSCVAMTLVCLGFHAHLQASCPGGHCH